jgi:hypothetical protein
MRKPVPGYRDVFQDHNGPGPYPCCFCGEPVDRIEDAPRSKDSLCIHHRDENRSNNAPENLAPAHNGCHVKHHMGKPRVKDGTAPRLSPGHGLHPSAVHYWKSIWSDGYGDQFNETQVEAARELVQLVSDFERSDDPKLRLRLSRAIRDLRAELRLHRPPLLPPPDYSDFRMIPFSEVAAA